jgi:Na+/H+-dicarboxylate symporter
VLRLEKRPFLPHADEARRRHRHCPDPLRQFIRAVREPAVLAFATTSSESALPKAMQAMERFGVPRHIVGFVMPAGYSFNLDGSTLYLAMASVFVAQAAETTMGFTCPSARSSP